jgi:hypothetical protein
VILDDQSLWNHKYKIPDSQHLGVVLVCQPLFLCGYAKYSITGREPKKGKLKIILKVKQFKLAKKTTLYIEFK